MTIDLTSSEDTFLFLLQGSGRGGAEEDQNDDIVSGNTDSQVVATLAAGTYTIEATTYNAATTGTFSLAVSVAGGAAGASPTTDSCLEDLGSLTGTVTRSGSWASGCPSENRTGSYARYYSFTLTEEREVTIDLTSSEDTFLFLLQGSGRGGAEEDQNDDIVSGNTDSQVVATLAAGTYTIEATTYNAATTGTFSLAVSVAGGAAGASPTTDSCLEDLGSLTGTVTRSGSWASGCPSENRTGSYARYYSFTLGEEREVTIDLTSSEDTFLFLLQGSGRGGAEEDQNDDIVSGNTDSQVVATLAAGTYTIEATTYNAATTGTFSLAVSVAGGAAGASPTTDSCLEDLGSLTGTVTRSGSWASGCPSENRTGSYARYYSFTLGEEREVTIDLTSSEDTFLFLLQGSGRGGAEEDQNDDIVSGNTDSQVVATLAAGTYTIEATTYNAATTGTFSLAVSVAGGAAGASPTTDSCLEELGKPDGDGDEDSPPWAILAPTPESDYRQVGGDRVMCRYQPYARSSYLPSPCTPRGEYPPPGSAIDLTSSVGHLPVPAAGVRPGRRGPGGPERRHRQRQPDSQVVATLAAGTYTIEASTYNAATTGTFGHCHSVAPCLQQLVSGGLGKPDGDGDEERAGQRLVGDRTGSYAGTTPHPAFLEREGPHPRQVQLPVSLLPSSVRTPTWQSSFLPLHPHRGSPSRNPVSPGRVAR